MSFVASSATETLASWPTPATASGGYAATCIFLNSERGESRRLGRCNGDLEHPVGDVGGDS